MKIIKDIKLCNGCTACKGICSVQAITMKQDEYGFEFPVIDDDRCIKCGQCQSICPINNAVAVNAEPVYLAAINKNEGVRMNSTSGGVFFALAEYTINKNGIVYGARYNKQFDVVHVGIDRIEDIDLLQGAKYTQSKLSDTFTEIKDYLISGREVLFSGTPCQVGGLKSFLGKDYNNLLTVDLVCHGVPSPNAWKEYLQYRKRKDNQNSDIKDINLRSKASGWSRYKYSVKVEYENRYTYECLNEDDLFMKTFINNMILRPSCSECHFKGVQRCSDFTLGDFWGIWDINPDMDDNKGTSLAIVQSQKGKHVWELVKDDFLVKEVFEEDAIKENRSIISSSIANKNREKVLEIIINQGFKRIEHYYKKTYRRSNKLLNQFIKRWN